VKPVFPGAGASPPSHREPPTQLHTAHVKTSALRLLKKNKRSLQPLPEPAAQAVCRKVALALERSSSGPPALLEPLPGLAQEPAEPHPFSSARFPAADGGSEGAPAVSSFSSTPSILAAHS
jgi:hypothetical protein